MEYKHPKLQTLTWTESEVSYDGQKIGHVENKRFIGKKNIVFENAEEIIEMLMEQIGSRISG